MAFVGGGGDREVTGGGHLGVARLIRAPAHEAETRKLEPFGDGHLHAEARIVAQSRVDFPSLFQKEELIPGREAEAFDGIVHPTEIQPEGQAFVVAPEEAGQIESQALTAGKFVGRLIADFQTAEAKPVFPGQLEAEDRSPDLKIVLPQGSGRRSRSCGLGKVPRPRAVGLSYRFRLRRSEGEKVESENRQDCQD